MFRNGGNKNHNFIQIFLNLFGYGSWEECLDKVIDIESLDQNAILESYNKQELSIKFRTIIQWRKVHTLRKAKSLHSFKEIISMLKTIARICGYNAVSAYTYTEKEKGKPQQYIKVVKEGEEFFNE